MKQHKIEEYKLIMISPKDDEYIDILYKWKCNETQSYRFTCRPVRETESYSEYLEFIKQHIQKGIQFYILKEKVSGVVLGKMTMFDYNPRNRSTEFGYYMPADNRNQGFGKIMSQLFLEHIFKDESLNLHKIYATTSSNNFPSIKILESLNFKLDGRLREHYWIDDEIYDQLHYSLLRKEFEL